MSFATRLRPARVLLANYPPRDASLPLPRRLSTMSLVQLKRSRCYIAPCSFSSLSAAVAPGVYSSTIVRAFSSSSPWDAEYQGRLSRRNKNIRLHPEGHGQHILPGNFVIKKHPKTGAERKVFLEHALGYFWAFKVRLGGTALHDLQAYYDGGLFLICHAPRTRS